MHKPELLTFKKYVGYVKWFSPTKGYGFISALNNNQDYFVHHTNIKPVISDYCRKPMFEFYRNNNFSMLYIYWLEGKDYGDIYVLNGGDFSFRVSNIDCDILNK